MELKMDTCLRVDEPENCDMEDECMCECWRSKFKDLHLRTRVLGLVVAELLDASRLALRAITEIKNNEQQATQEQTPER